MDEGISSSINRRYTSWVREALDELPHSFTISDPWIPGHPIVFASRELLKTSGYSREEVVGNNGRMFQGPNTNRRSLTEIRQALREERTIQLTLLNYGKNGTPFWILFHMFPVFSKEDDGRVVHFVGVQVPIMPRRSNQAAAAAAAATLGFCRREISSDTIAQFPNLDLAEDHHDTEFINTAWMVTDLEKQQANASMANILSLLTHYSQLTGRLVSENRCCSSYMTALGTSLMISLSRIKQSFVLTDPHKTDTPIVYASDAFLELTGYTRHEVLGQRCRFLSGQETDVSTELQITNSIETRKACTVCILNYRKDGSPFWNSLHISPVRNASGKTTYFVEVQMNVNYSDEKPQNVRPEMSVVAAVKVAVRSSGIMATTSNS